MGVIGLEAVRGWAFSLCAAAIVGAIAEMFAPEGGARRIFRLCVSVFFLCCLFSPALELISDGISQEDWEIDSPDDAYMEQAQGLNGAYERRVAEDFRRNVERLAQEALESAGINNAEIAVSVNIDMDNCISISEVEVTLSEDMRPQELRAIMAVEQSIGIKPAVRFGGG